MKRTPQTGGDPVADGAADRIEHKVIDIKDSVRRRVNAVQGGELCQLKKERKAEGKQDGLTETAVKIAAQIDAERQEQTQIAPNLKPGGISDIDMAGA